jgi:hypothetical protein
MIIQYIVAAVLIGHGIGHLTGVLAAFTPGGGGFRPESWLFSKGVTPASTVGKLWSLVWLAAMGAFIAAGIALLARPDWWPSLPIVAALLSLAAIVPWWNAVVPGAKAGALLDVLVLAVLVPGWRDQVMQALGL